MSHEIRIEPHRLDLDGSMAALQRAARRAREDAIRTKTKLVIVRDGKLEQIAPSDLAGADPSELKPDE